MKGWSLAFAIFQVPSIGPERPAKLSPGPRLNKTELFDVFQNKREAKDEKLVEWRRGVIVRIGILRAYARDSFGPDCILFEDGTTVRANAIEEFAEAVALSSPGDVIDFVVGPDTQGRPHFTRFENHTLNALREKLKKDATER